MIYAECIIVSGEGEKVGRRVGGGLDMSGSTIKSMRGCIIRREARGKKDEHKDTRIYTSLLVEHFLMAAVLKTADQEGSRVVV